MPYSAGEMVGQMNANQHQEMLMQSLGNMNSGARADNLASSVAAKSLAIGVPVATLGLGLMGLNPIGMGIGAGMSAYGAGAGVLGAGLVGLGAAGVVGLGSAAVGYMGHMTVRGAQEQLDLNRNLARNFNFVNRQGHMGFTSHQGYEIGHAIHSMAGLQGPSGEVATFGELSRLASNMGRMGLAQNVRTVTEFKEKFKQMIDTIKVVAKELGTSLEEAQKMMASMKGSGIFSSAAATRLSHEMKLGVFTGGLATSEISAAASIGSQISRSVGGLGRQGAFGGALTIQQIGLAQKIGVITEEDIYNATGLTGAEGRQALASSQMQRSASFLQSGRGRRFLASVASANGTLDETSVSEYLTGDVGVGRTRELSQRNLRGVGRADFIRNEGRLRGAVLERFGGLAQTMAYKEWLASKGFDPTTMDDRSMLAFQRFTGMGRDEADVAIREVRALPQIMEERMQAERMSQYSEDKAQYAKTHGVEGLKRKFDHYKHMVNSTFEHIGQRFMEATSKKLESFLNGLLEAQVDFASEGIEDIASSMFYGGANAKSNFRRYFNPAGSAFAKGASMGSQQDRLLKDYDQRMLMATFAGAGAVDPKTLAFAKQFSESVKLTTLGTMDTGSGSMLAKFGKMIGEKAKTGDAAAVALNEVWSKSNSTQRAAILGGIQEASGVIEEGKFSTILANESKKYRSAGLEASVFKTIEERNEALGRLIAGNTKTLQGNTTEDLVTRAKDAGTVGDMMAALVASAPADVGAATFASSRRGMEHTEASVKVAFADYSEKGSNQSKRYQGLASVFTDTDNIRIFSDLIEGSSVQQASARSAIIDKITKLKGLQSKNPEYDYSIAGQIEGLELAYVGSQDLKDDQVIAKYREMTGSKESDAEILRKVGSVREQGLSSALEMQAVENFKQYTKVTSDRHREVLRNAAMSGHYDAANQSVRTDYDKLIKEGKLDKASVAAAKMADKLLSFSFDKPSEEAIANLADEKYASYIMTPEGQKALEDGKETGGSGFSRGGNLYDRFVKEAEESVRTNPDLARFLSYKEYEEQRDEAISKITSQPIAKLREMAAHTGGYAAEFARFGVRSYNAYQGAKKGKRGEKVSDVEAVGKLIGFELTDEERGFIGKGTTKEQLANMFEVAGFGGDKYAELRGQLESALAEKSDTARATKIQQAFAGNAEYREIRGKLRDAADESDPQLSRLKEISKKLDKLEDIRTGIYAVAGKTAPPSSPNPEGNNGGNTGTGNTSGGGATRTNADGTTD